MIKTSKAAAILAAQARFSEFQRKKKQAAASQAEIAYNTRVWAEAQGTTVWRIQNGF